MNTRPSFPEDSSIHVSQSPMLDGTVHLTGAKNAALVIIASLILADGTSTLHNIPNSSDVQCIIILLRALGAQVSFDEHLGVLTVNTASMNRSEVTPDIMGRMRASILVMGPLLARFGRAHIARPGGCLIGARPINYHLEGFKKLGVVIDDQPPFLYARFHNTKDAIDQRLVLESPSVGATENLLMFATLRPGITTLINAAIEPEVIDLIDVLKNMGANITYGKGAEIIVEGVSTLRPIVHAIIPDRLEAGMLLLAGCITGGQLHIPNARADHLDLVLDKISAMGHRVMVGTNPTATLPLQGVCLQAIEKPVAVSIKTGPYPSFPTDLQAQMMAALSVCDGISTVEETMFENRFMHITELQKMGAQIAISGNRATVRGVGELYGTEVIARDIRASCALVLAGLRAHGTTVVLGLDYWRRCHDRLEEKLRAIGAHMVINHHGPDFLSQPTTQLTPL